MHLPLIIAERDICLTSYYQRTGKELSPVTSVAMFSSYMFSSPVETAILMAQLYFIMIPELQEHGSVA